MLTGSTRSAAAHRGPPVNTPYWVCSPSAILSVLFTAHVRNKLTSIKWQDQQSRRCRMHVAKKLCKFVVSLCPAAADSAMAASECSPTVKSTIARAWATDSFWHLAPFYQWVLGLAPRLGMGPERGTLRGAAEDSDGVVDTSLDVNLCTRGNEWW